MNIITEFTPNPQNDGKVKVFIVQNWGSENIVSKGKITNASKISRVIVKDSGGDIIGLATFLIDKKDNSCELISIDSKYQRKGVGSKMIEIVEKSAKKAGAKKIWLITTNDNYDAAIFYIKRGYCLSAVHKNALEVSRKLKPQIPLKGKYDIFLRDEWEFEKSL
jgi:N-acetylglutamate synthase-like GNAT family acetyltransferase